MVTTAHPFATHAGLAMLREGGNAVDAAVAATMVAAVLDTGKTSFAGGGELTYYSASTGKTVVINFEPNAVRDDVKPYVPERDSRTGRSIRVPGTIAGLHLGTSKYGALSWSKVMEPAIFYAENGFPLHGDAYATLRGEYATLTLQPSGRQVFAPDGFLPAVGSLFKQPELAATLRKIAAGPDYFYKGELATKMVEAIRDIGGKATQEDFASYRPLELEPVRGSYQDFEIVGASPPATGVAAIIEGMNILEHVDLRKLGHYADSADSLNWMIEVLRVIGDDVGRYNGVPELDRGLARLLMSKDYARRQYELIHHKIKQMRHQEGKTGAKVAVRKPRDERPMLGTNHVAVVDEEGNVCSITHTIYGSTFSTHGLFVDGIVLNSSGGFRAQPGGRIVSSMPATIVFKGGKPYFACGSSGGYPNPFFLIANVLSWGKDFKQAQEAPRFRVEAGNVVRIEHRIADGVAEELRRRGYRIEWEPPYAMRNAQIAGIDLETGIRLGAADPRGEGHAAGQ